MSARPAPPPEVAVDADLVRALLEEQHPDLAGLRLRPVAAGWDNEVYRLGDHLAVRLPRREVGSRLVEHELDWLPEVADRLPLPVPVPVRRGRPGAGYPWSWSVVPWFDGVTADCTPPADPATAAAVLGRFIAALAVPAPPDAPVNAFRGVPLVARDAKVREHLARWGTDAPFPVRDVERRWDEALAVPDWTGPPVWLHGDLHPANLLVHAGRLSAVIDWGDITSGDPATDLSVAWMLLADSVDRESLCDAAGGADDDTWARARGNALAHGLLLTSHSADSPAMTAMGLRTIHTVLTDAG